MSLIVFLVVTFATATVGSFFPPGEWYAELAKPGWTPPNWLFGPVWTLLYIAIAVSGWLVWRQLGTIALFPALTLFGVQLMLNASWSWVFFGQQRPDLALVVIVLLEVSILGLIALFQPISKTAALLLVPYAVWVGFATALNAAIWSLNR